MDILDIEDVFPRNCCYPECSNKRFTCARTCGYLYPLCKIHVVIKLYLSDGLLSSHTDDIGTPSELNIWYKNRVITQIGSIVDMYISLYGCDNLIRFVYDSPKKKSYDSIIYIKGKYSGWYDWDYRSKNLTLDYCNMENHTYKYKLYNMRLPDLYFGAIPLDILDEVIMYL